MLTKKWLSGSPQTFLHQSKALAAILILLLFSCSNFFDNIDLEDALLQDYNRVTEFYGIKVSVDNRVDEKTNELLGIIDRRSRSFLNCQFMEGGDIGFIDFELESGVIVPPLSDMRVWIVDFTFDCGGEAEDKDVCGGIYYPSEDLMIIAEESIGRCGLLPLFKHELAHRYGLKSNHSNQDDFDFCSMPPDCDIFREVGRFE